MTPKVKAEWLLAKFKNEFHGTWSDSIDVRISKRCAMLAVDELIKSTPVSSRILTDYKALDKQFWQDVLKEIELL